ncbi:MAG: 4-hydroxy-tetrahydrodipicolinate synthase [SAR324 cluster bacterium]|nr:4-hydroxy-tetrahydrodipicolinate synthase [SAR324 cluster bacterium]MCZ6841634.1 4-hydroxy-tetrahydrodipicolinate synthase [SAR324 cluster bacterium]
MTASQITGVGTAMITPFQKDGAVDLAKLADFIEFQISGGVQFLVPMGTTGESVTLSKEEQIEVIKTTLKVANGQVPVLAGCGGNNTASLIKLGNHLKDIGVKQILSVSPYYNKPNQEGIYQHFKAIRNETGLDIVLYNIPGRTGSNVLPETLARMTEEDIIFGVKESSGDIKQIQQLCQLTGDSLKVFSGDDWMTLALVGVGGTGVISVASNVVPGPMRKYMDALQARDFVEGRRLLKDLLPLFDGLFTEPNPQPVKGAASLLGLMDANFRLPMVPPSESTMHLMKELLAPFSGK